MMYFTNNPLERMMMQTPGPVREATPPPAPKGHPCNGCKRYGEGCALPCYRGVAVQTVERRGGNALCDR